MRSFSSAGRARTVFAASLARSRRALISAAFLTTGSVGGSVSSGALKSPWGGFRVFVITLAKTLPIWTAFDGKII
jgi:hypothetical protein